MFSSEAGLIFCLILFFSEQNHSFAMEKMFDLRGKKKSFVLQLIYPLLFSA